MLPLSAYRKNYELATRLSALACLDRNLLPCHIGRAGVGRRRGQPPCFAPCCADRSTLGWSSSRISALSIHWLDHVAIVSFLVCADVGHLALFAWNCPSDKWELFYPRNRYDHRCGVGVG